MNINLIVHTVILTSLTLILLERFLMCYNNLMDESTAFEEKVFADRTTFPSFTFCPINLEESHSIESFEDVVTNIQIAKSKYTSHLSSHDSFGLR